MHEKWSLVFNVLLLIGVIIAIGRLMHARRQNLSSDFVQPTLTPVADSPYEAELFNDDIISVRKVSPQVLSEFSSEEQASVLLDSDKTPQLLPQKPSKSVQQTSALSDSGSDLDCFTTFAMTEEQKRIAIPSTIMMFLAAKEHRRFAGYELLQTLLAAGLRFGEGSLFHRHQSDNGQGSVLCSLASATHSGIFDLQNIGAFSTHGLCLFMHTARDSDINAERFSALLDTAKQLSQNMDAHLLDEERQPLTEEKVMHYCRVLCIDWLLERPSLQAGEKV